MPRYWTKKEDQYLLDNWFEPMTVLAKKLKTGDGGVRGRLKKLGIERPKGKEANMVLRASIYREKNKEKVPKDWLELPSTRKEAKEKKSFFIGMANLVKEKVIYQKEKPRQEAAGIAIMVIKKRESLLIQSTGKRGINRGENIFLEIVLNI